MIDFSKFKAQFDTDAVKAAEDEYAKQEKQHNANGGNYKDLPSGVYAVELKNLEKKHVTFPSGDKVDQIAIEFRIIDGEHKNQHIFYNGSYDEHFAHGLNTTSRLISEMTGGQLEPGLVRAMLEAGDAEDKLTDLFQMLSGQFNYDLDYEVKVSKKINPHNGKPYVNKFFSIEEVYDN